MSSFDVVLNPEYGKIYVIILGTQRKQCQILEMGKYVTSFDVLN